MREAPQNKKRFRAQRSCFLRRLERERPLRKLGVFRQGLRRCTCRSERAICNGGYFTNSQSDEPPKLCGATEIKISWLAVLKILCEGNWMPPSDQDVAVAQWMLQQVQQEPLYQQRAAEQIRTQFGEEFTYRNSKGHLLISANVLKAFRNSSGDTVVWVDRRGRHKHWRLRQPTDAPGKKQRR